MRRVALLLVLAPLVLAACGSSGSSSSQQQLSPSASLKHAAKKSAQATSEHVDLKGTAAVQGQRLSLTGSGDFDNASHQGTMTAHAGVAGVTVDVDEVLDGTTIYMKSPLFAATLPGGKTWLKLDLQKLGKANGVDFGALLSQNPAQTLGQLQASGRVSKVGDETIDGVATTHYRATIDPSKIPQGQQLQALTNAKYGPYNVWIGKDDGYVHRVVTSYSYAVPGSTGRQSFTLTENFSDFGKTVTVDVPPASDVVDATSQSLKALGG